MLDSAWHVIRVWLVNLRLTLCRTTLPVYEDKQAVAPAFAKCSGGHGKVGSVGQVDAANQDTSTTVPGMQQPETAVPEAGQYLKHHHTIWGGTYVVAIESSML